MTVIDLLNKTDSSVAIVLCVSLKIARSEKIQPISGSTVQACACCQQDIFVHPSSLQSVADYGKRSAAMVCETCVDEALKSIEDYVRLSPNKQEMN